MSRRGDEVQAALHSAVWHLPSVDSGLCVEVILKLAVNVIDDGLPAEDDIINNDTMILCESKKKKKNGQ